MKTTTQDQVKKLQEPRSPSGIRFRLKPNGCVEIVTGNRFEIINLENGETVGGNVTHLEEVRKKAIDFAFDDEIRIAPDLPFCGK